MVALAQRIIKLEKKVAARPLSSNVIYQPSEEEWAAAMEILVAVGAMIPPAATPSASTIARPGTLGLPPKCRLQLQLGK